MFEVYKGYVTFAPYNMVLDHLVVKCTDVQDTKNRSPWIHGRVSRVYDELCRKERRLLCEISVIEKHTGLKSMWGYGTEDPFKNPPNKSTKGVWCV